MNCQYEFRISSGDAETAEAAVDKAVASESFWTKIKQDGNSVNWKKHAATGHYVKWSIRSLCWAVWIPVMCKFNCIESRCCCCCCDAMPETLQYIVRAIHIRTYLHFLVPVKQNKSSMRELLQPTVIQAIVPYLLWLQSIQYSHAYWMEQSVTSNAFFDDANTVHQPELTKARACCVTYTHVTIRGPITCNPIILWPARFCSSVNSRTFFSVGLAPISNGKFAPCRCA